MRLRSRAVPATVTATVMLLLTGLGGCSSGAPATGSNARAATIPLLRVGDDAALTSALDVGQDEGNDVYGALETLTKFGPAGQLEAELAASVSHPNATTYVYRLREGVKFWNGDPMTSANPLLASGLATSDPTRRLAIYGQLLKQVDADVPYVPLFSGYSFVALSGKYTLPPFPDYAAFFSWALGLKQAAS
jgi:ABC-type transport system substrate-binding protein